jgi:glutaredoxin 3
MSLKIEIYGRESCPFCVAAVAYCATRAYPFVFLDLDIASIAEELLLRSPLAITAPQIFIGPHRIGGIETLRAKDALIQQLLGGHANDL